MKKLSLAAILAITTIGSISLVQADELGINGNIGATSNYIWRGMTQTDDKSSVNGGIDLDYKGFYVGTWASNVDFKDDAQYELDVYAGYSNTIEDLTYDLSYIKYLYPGSDGSSDFDEITVAIGYDINDLSLGASHAFGTYVENNGIKNDYTELTASYDFEILTFDTSFGDYENTGSNYTVGISKSFELEGNSLDLSLVYSNFDADTGSTNDQENVYSTISYSF